MSGPGAGDTPLPTNANAAPSPARAADPLAAGWAALSTADWRGAKAGFTAALRAADSPAAHDGLGLALWWLTFRLVPES